MVGKSEIVTSIIQTAVEKEVVLIVDDCPGDRHRFCRLLSSSIGERQFTLLEADTVAEGLEMYRSHQPACVLLDYSLPDADGIEFLKCLSRETKVLPVIMLTGAGEESIAAEAMKLGIQDHLTKGSGEEVALRKLVLNAIDKSILQRHLEEQRVQITAFAQTAAHDLKAPLRQIRCFPKLLREHLGELSILDTEVVEYLQFIEGAAVEMEQLVDALMIYAMVGHNANPPALVHLSELMKVVLSNFEAALEKTGGSLQIGSMPTVIGDRTGLLHVFNNLVGNGIKYNRRSPVVRVSAEQDGQHWHCCVQDNGIGIEPKYHQEIFDPFRRLHTKRDYEGSGIGLAICKKVLKEHGGKIWVESLSGQGTVFHLLIPIQR